MSLVPIDLSRAPGAKLTVNALVSSPSMADLDQDLVLVELPGSLFIDVSWHPENERPGAYYLTVFRRNDWDNPEEEIETKTPQLAALMVAILAEKHTVPAGSVSRSSESEFTYFHPKSAA